MSDTLGKIIALVAPGAGGGSDQSESLRPLSSALGHLMVSDANHLAHENPLRTVFTHRGTVETKALYAPAFDNYVGAPDPETINWEPPIDATGARTGRFSLRMGRVVVHKSADGLRWPKITCRFRMLAPATYTVGAVFVLNRSESAFPMNTSSSLSDYTTSTTYVDITLTIQITDEDVLTDTLTLAPGSASGPLPVVETVSVKYVLPWLGAYCSSNSSAACGALVGVSAFLIDP